MNPLSYCEIIISMKALQHLSNYIDQVGLSAKSIRFIALGGGVLTAVGHYLHGPSVEWQIISGTLFWFGLFVMLATNLLLVFIDRQSVEILKSLYDEEKKSDGLEGLANENKALISWNTLMKINFELLDRALLNPTMDEDSRSRIFSAAVKCVAGRKYQLFGIEDDYLNISLYEYSDTDKKLHCIACYRSPPFDSGGPYRSWNSGEGHVGRTFELKREWVCPDTRDPNVANWFEPSLKNKKDTDKERYISLIAVPIAVDVDRPLGVIIVTSDQPQRFVNRSDVNIDSKARHPAVEALQDIASQLAQLMCILKMGELDSKKEEGNG